MTKVLIWSRMSAILKEKQRIIKDGIGCVKDMIDTATLSGDEWGKSLKGLDKGTKYSLVQCL
jgi:hypothetical protein